jgi:DNA-binding MarR family transcriptional regulator
MRRVILEVPIEEIEKFGAKDLYQKIKSFEVLHLLRYDQKEFAAICRIEFANASTKLADLFPGEKIRAQMLEQEKENIFTYFMKGDMQAHARAVKELTHFDTQWLMGFAGTEVYFELIEFKDRRLKISFMGNPRQVKALLELLEKGKIQHRIVSVTDAKVALHSPLDCLTEKQRNVLVTAFECGYYDLPRKTSSKELAKKLNLKSPTLVEHRRKAERRVLAELLRE